MNEKGLAETKKTSLQQYLWVYPEVDSDWCEEIQREFHFNPITARLLANRDFSSLEKLHSYLYAKLPDLHDPGKFVDMEKATQRLVDAYKYKQNVLIYGDNDVDGMTGTALLTEFFRQIGLNVHFYIANRTTPRKEFIIESLEYALEKECKLLITVDCGVTSSEQIQKIIDRGIDVIVTDHHEPTDKVPNCIATLNPKLVNNNYPNRELTGVGVAFKLAHAVANTFIFLGIIQSNAIDLKSYLDLVALGTVSDMGSLLGENRILVRYGLEELSKQRRVGLTKLFQVCDLTKTNRFTTSDIASKVAPRLNSLGRIDEPRKGVELLLLRDEEKAHQLALELDLNNSERQKIERGVSEGVEEIIKKNPAVLNNNAIVLDADTWHSGVIPIISTRISKLYNRPTIIIAVENGIGKGSIRSIPEFPLLQILKNTEDLFLNYGGHDFAAGITIMPENIPEFRKRFIAMADKVLNPRDVTPKLFLDTKVCFEDLTFDLMESLSLLEPYGNENGAPLFYTEAHQAWLPKVIGKQHLKVYLEQKDRILEGIGFGFAKFKPLLKKKGLNLNIVFSPHINDFQNKSSIQMILRDLQYA